MLRAVPQAALDYESIPHDPEPRKDTIYRLRYMEAKVYQTILKELQ